jgi:hypothetical protein
MMKRRTFLFSGAAMLLAGCATPGTTPPGPGPVIPVNLLQTILGYLQTGCSVVADIGAITALIGTFPAGTAAVVIANAVCAYISRLPKGRLGGSAVIGSDTFPAVTVHGVVIPYAHLGTPLAARLRSGPLPYVIVNGVTVPYGNLPRP